MLRTFKHSVFALLMHFRRGDHGLLTVRAILLLLVLASGVAFSQAAKEKNENQKAVTDNTTAEKKSGPNAPAVLINITGNAQGVDNTCKTSDCNKEPEIGWWKKLLTDPIATFTGALFLATAALIGTGLVQWFETRSTAKRQLRAYVWQDTSTAPSNWDDGYRAEFEIKNSGTTPAYKVCCWARMKPLDHLAIAEYEFEQAPKEIKGPRFVVHPGSFHTQSEGARMTADEQDAVRRDVKRLFIWGEIRYKDAFDKDHTTQFRLVWRESFGKGIWTYCDDGNDAD